MQHFYSHDIVLCVVIQHNSRRDLLRIFDLAIRKAQIKCVNVRVNRQFHSLPFMARSKCNVTIFSGVVRGSHTTCRTRSLSPQSPPADVQAPDRPRRARFVADSRSLAQAKLRQSSALAFELVHARSGRTSQLPLLRQLLFEFLDRREGVAPFPDAGEDVV